ncbi:mucin-5AC-like [Anopheles funestus]|uniref:mucin-5AC-like n=1 Tax=Anopheles funestus TaxID=62324 RepID=UPI0020C6ED92|nr:mucin-5AC-like [Anopheles funestus]
MRKKFVQTLAAQQLELSSHIRTHEMELEKESPRAQQQRTQSGSGPEDVIEIIDDDQEVELMMERHRKYHPRKYVNLQQPTSKVYYDKIDTMDTSPAPDKDDHDMEEEDEDKLMVIDCAKEGTQTKEPNNNSANAPNGNVTMLDSNGELSGPVSYPSKTNDAQSGRTQSNDQQTASGGNWHVPQNVAQLGGKHSELRQHLLQREKMMRSRTDIPAPSMFQQQQQQYGPPSYQRSQRSHPYERHPSESSGTTTMPSYKTPQQNEGKSTATPHSRTSQSQRSPKVGGIPSGISLGGGEGRKSAFSSPQDKRLHDVTMMPGPTLAAMAGSASSVAIAPRTPFYQHHPYVAPYHYHPAYSANTTPSASTYHTLEEWYRAGYPAPHLLSPTELQYYYHCYLSKYVLSAPGYHPHDQHYRDYSSLAMTPGAGTAYYPPPQYGFVKPPTNSVVVASPAPNVTVPTPAAGGSGGVTTARSAYPANQPIDFSHYNDHNVPTLGAGFLSETLPPASTQANAVSQQSKSYSIVPSTTLHYTPPQSETIRPSVINHASAPPAKGSPSAAHTASLKPPSTSTTVPQPPQPSSIMLSPTTALPSTMLSPSASLPSTMLSPSSMPSPTKHPAPPPNMPSLSSTMPSPSSQPPVTNPPTSTAAPTPVLSPSSMMPPPTRHPPPSMPSLSSTMPPPSSPSSARRNPLDMPKLPPPPLPLPPTNIPSSAHRTERTDPRADLPPSVGKADTNLSNNVRNDPRSDFTSKEAKSDETDIIRRTRKYNLQKPSANFGSRYEQPSPTLSPHTPKRRGRRPSSSSSSHHKASSQMASKPSDAAARTTNTNGERNIGVLLQQMRREMMSFLQQRRSDIISTMRIYTIGRMDFGGFLVEMKRHSVTYRDFMHVAFTLMRRCGYSGFAMEPPAELDYRWKNPPQEFADYFAKNDQCNKQFVADNFDFLLLIVDNLLQQYFEPMEFFLLTYVLGLRAK